MSDAPDVDVKEVLREYGWTLGPKFDERYYTDPWVFNLVNIIERQASRIRTLELTLRADRGTTETGDA